MMEVTPEENIMGCPAKMGMLVKLWKEKQIRIADLQKESFVFKPSFLRHIEELVFDNMARRTEDGQYLVSTTEGDKFAKRITKDSKDFVRSFSSTNFVF
ncbi:MAG: hypothetical protein K5798_01820 [Nitrosopumilus sp.]|uniref:hypothetical protein n=1 Tax=Nitrosopumilus sp. TaxID=2024843 RepID=UPI0024316586|nr:hypothetical protein [Nitrosopumilus sp.]MCV0365989.1 hypothetical protein [Nitrosopumilus sp.]